MSPLFPKAPPANGGGNLITTAFAIGQRIAEHLSHIIDVIEAAREREEYRRVVLQDVADATGTCVLRWTGATDRDFELVYFAAACGTANQLFAIYHSEVDDRNLIYATATGQKFSADFGPGEYLPDGTTLVVVFSGQVAGATCTFNMRTKMLAHDPSYTPNARAAGGGFMPAGLLVDSDYGAAPNEGENRRVHGGG